MEIRFTNIHVDDQEKALAFYTGVLGFMKMADIPMGDYRWLTVVSPEGIRGVELVLELLAFPPAIAYNKALFDAGIPSTAFTTKDIKAEVGRLKAKGVVFRGEPQNQGPITNVLFEDGCG
ncbi:MAG: VOC family protein, partial [Spirochaetia bacterium]